MPSLNIVIFIDISAAFRDASDETLTAREREISKYIHAKRSKASKRRGCDPGRTPVGATLRSSLVVYPSLFRGRDSCKSSYTKHRIRGRISTTVH